MRRERGVNRRGRCTRARKASSAPVITSRVNGREHIHHTRHEATTEGLASPTQRGARSPECPEGEMQCSTRETSWTATR